MYLVYILIHACSFRSKLPTNNHPEPIYADSVGRYLN